MQRNTNAIVLSLGMLLEKVNIPGFMGTMLKKAAEENPNFVFTPELQSKAFTLCSSFNLGKMKSETLEAEILKLLGITTMQSEEFWSEWDKMLSLGNVVENIKLLQETMNQHNTLVYLYSDTNMVHLKKIAKESAMQEVKLDMEKTPMLFGQLLLYPTCQIGKNNEELTEHIVKDIRSKEFNKPDVITLILGNPENVTDVRYRASVKSKFDQTASWCEKNGVAVQMHNNSLSETLAKIFTPENTETNVFKIALG